MKLEELVCSLELSKKLKVLGVKQNSIFVYEYLNDKCYIVQYKPYAALPNPFNQIQWFAALTASELIEILPAWINDCNLVIKKFPKVYQVKYCNSDNSKILATDLDDSIANALAKIRIHLLENNLITLDAQQ